MTDQVEDFNATKTLELLRIADLAKNWPHLRSIHDLAMSELDRHEKSAKAEVDKRTKARVDAKAKAEAELQARIVGQTPRKVEVPDPPTQPARTPFPIPQAAPTTVRGSFVGTEDAK